MIKFSRIKVDVKNYLPDLPTLFQKWDEVVAAYLFGSHARGCVGPLSDVDVAVLFDEGADIDHIYLKLCVEVSKALHTDEVDLLILNKAPVTLKHKVLKEGKMLFCRDEIKRIRFQVKVINDYIDTKPLRDMYNRELFKRIKKGIPSGRYWLYRKAFRDT
jgi:predicted nucleotidyltransferase